MKWFWKDSSSKRLIFIVGCPRSGTSWTWGLLSSFKRVEPLLIEDFPSLAEKHDTKQMKTDEGFITTETGIFHWNLSDREIRRGIARKMNQHPKALLLEKTPANALELDRITSLFPQAKIIHVIRDPRAVINSMLQSKFSSGLRLAGTVEEAINLYQRYADATEPYKDYPNLIRVRYEALFKAPELTLKTLCQFIDLPICEEQVEQVVQANATRSQTVTSNDFRKGEIDSYKYELGKQELLKIERELSAVFNLYGYPCELKQV